MTWILNCIAKYESSVLMYVNIIAEHYLTSLAILCVVYPSLIIMLWFVAIGDVIAEWLGYHYAR